MILKNKTIPIIDQLLRSALSIGANYQEANGASSKKDFKNKIFICKKSVRRQNIGLGCLLKQMLVLSSSVENYGKRLMN